MKPERWAQVKIVVADALELPAPQRPAFLDRVCGSDDSLRREVESLLATTSDGDSLPGVRHAIASVARSAAEDHDVAQRATLEQAVGTQYEILRSLGRGGMGSVYLARERSLDRFVAVKVLRPDLAATSSARERFRREARIAAHLSHPGIVPLHAFGEVGGLCYFVMGYMRGVTLAERLRLEGRVPWVEAHRMLMELTDALASAHKHGIIHRDIKPANILLDDESGRTMLADFGISKMLSGGNTITATGAVVGTPGFMSPEQMQSDVVDERSDLYSLGAVAYTMLAGREPFSGTNTRELMADQLARDPEPLRSTAPAVPPELADVVMKCLVRDRSARWQSARDLREALVQAAESASAPLPEPVRDLPSFGAYALLWVVAWGSFAAMGGHEPGERVLLLLIAFLVPLGLALHVWNVGRHGLGPAQLARVAAWPPEWWGMWWPRSLRRPSDLWPRLPFPARLVRVALSGVFLLVPGLIVLRQWMQSRRVVEGHVDWQWFFVAETAVVGVAALVVVVALAWSQRQGLSVGESIRLLFGATSDSSSWAAPRLSRLLQPVAGGVRPPDRDVPSDHRRAIDALAEKFPPDGSDVAGDAVRAAARALAAIEQSDRERASLARDADSREMDRLSEQLASYGEPMAGESSEKRELRELVRHQLELVRKLRARREELTRRRAHLMDLLRGLWTQLLDTRDAMLAGSAEAARCVNRVREICAEIDAATAAAQR